jgi:hypothetical protein
MFLAYTESAYVTITYIYNTPLNVMLYYYTLPNYDLGGIVEIPNLPRLLDLKIAVIAFTLTETGLL